LATKCGGEEANNSEFKNSRIQGIKAGVSSRVLDFLNSWLLEFWGHVGHGGGGVLVAGSDLPMGSGRAAKLLIKANEQRSTVIQANASKLE
jgi:hypothetical protein